MKNIHNICNIILFYVACHKWVDSIDSNSVYFTHFLNSLSDEFDISEFTLICQSAEEASNKISFNKLSIPARLIGGEDFALDSVSALSDAIVLLSDNLDLIRTASDVGQLEKSIWLIPFINDTAELDFDLRLDSKLYMFDTFFGTEFWLYEVYSIKKGPKIVRLLGKWNITDKTLELKVSIPGAGTFAKMIKMTIAH